MGNIELNEVDLSEDPKLEVTYEPDGQKVTFCFTASVDGDPRVLFPAEQVEDMSDREVLHQMSREVFEQILAYLEQ